MPRTAKKDTGASSTTPPANKGTPKSVLDKIIHAIRSSPPGANGAVSRVSIVKYIKSEFDYDNPSQIKNALKRGVSSGSLAQKGQSFAVAKDPPRASAPQGEPIKVEDVKEGEGETAARGDTVTVKYAGTLEDKTKFDSASSFEFLLGAGDVIKGWDQVGQQKRISLWDVSKPLEVSFHTFSFF
jgi:FKBP-type peptidyl-prolyl cis-trans isomerase